MVDRGEPAQPGFTEQGHVDAESQRAKPGIGADIARRLLAADMLLARRERQHKAALAVGIDRLAAQASRHLADIFGLARSEEHTSELQSLMRISYAVFCLKKKTTTDSD